MELVGVRCPARVEPRLVVIANGIDDERVTFPTTGRVSPPCRDQIIRIGMFPAVHEDLPDGTAAALLVDDVDRAETFRGYRLNEIPRERILSRDAHRRAV